jgi:hypothetical protein
MKYILIGHKNIDHQYSILLGLIAQVRTFW